MANQTDGAMLVRDELLTNQLVDHSNEFTEGPSKIGNLEHTADMLLRTVGVLKRRKSTVYTEVQLSRKIRDERSHLPMLDEFALPNDVVDYLLECWIDELIEASSLSLRQEIVLRMSLCGFSCEDIAVALNRRRQSVSALLKAARRKVQTTYADGRYAGWYEVYLSEVNRTTYRRKRG